MAFLSVLALGACVPTQEAPAAPVGRETVSVPLSSDSDAEAQRLCGSAVRPESVHHESNVVTYRCLRGAH